jgi:ferritin-like metal-binding protein YciE
MSTFGDRPAIPLRPQNVSPAERWLSVVTGLGLLLSASRGGALGRLVRGGAALSLLTRGTTGFCAMKAALRGDVPFTEGLQEQWRRLTAVGSAATARTDAEHIDSMESMYESEFQELHSAETQLATLANDLARTIGNAEVAFRLQEYATELQSRRVDLESLLTRIGAQPWDQPDDAMRALIRETRKMARISADNVRDAAIVASIQRIIHYKIAGYGTIAAYAKALGRSDEAAHFAQLADRDKSIDAELTELAKKTLNPEAVRTPAEQPTAEQKAASSSRPH